MEIKTIEKKRVASSLETTGNPFPTWKEMQQIRKERTSRYGFDPATESGTLSHRTAHEYDSAKPNRDLSIHLKTANE